MSFHGLRFYGFTEQIYVFFAGSFQLLRKLEVPAPEELEASAGTSSFRSLSTQTRKLPVAKQAGSS